MKTSRYIIYPSYLWNFNKINSVIRTSQEEYYDDISVILEGFCKRPVIGSHIYDIFTLYFVIRKDMDQMRSAGIVLPPRILYKDDVCKLVAFMMTLLNYNILMKNVADFSLPDVMRFTVDDTVFLLRRLKSELKLSDEDEQCLLTFFVNFDYIEYMDEKEIIISDDK